jgi:hypothetical protein
MRASASVPVRPVDVGGLLEFTWQAQEELPQEEDPEHAREHR